LKERIPIDEWRKKYSPYGKIYSLKELAELLDMGYTNFHHRYKNKSQMLDQKTPRLAGSHS
jgi:hypothetical protein